MEKTKSTTANGLNIVQGSLHKIQKSIRVDITTEKTQKTIKTNLSMLQHCRRFINHNLCDLVSIYRWRVHMQVWSVNCAQLADFITYDTLETVNIKQLDTNHYKPVPTNLVKNSKEATVSTQAIGKHCLWWQKTSLPIKIFKKEEEKKVTMSLNREQAIVTKFTPWQ